MNTGKLIIARVRFFAAAFSTSGLLFTEKGHFAQALTLTPCTTESPYYPDKLLLDRDNDLLVINAITPAVGTIAWLSGRVPRVKCDTPAPPPAQPLRNSDIVQGF